MFYKTFKIAEDITSNTAWEIEIRLYSDGVGVSTGLGDFLLIDYIDVDKIISALENEEQGTYVVECNVGDNLIIDNLLTTTILYIDKGKPLAIIPNPYKWELVELLKAIEK